jgi:hypothetical protein
MLQLLAFHRTEISKFDPEAWLSPAALVTSRRNGFGATVCIYARDLGTRIRPPSFEVKVPS